MAPKKQLPSLKTLCFSTIEQFVERSTILLIREIESFRRQIKEESVNVTEIFDFLELNVFPFNRYLFDELPQHLIEEMQNILGNCIATIFNSDKYPEFRNNLLGIHSDYYDSFHGDNINMVTENRCLSFLNFITIHHRVRKMKFNLYAVKCDPPSKCDFLIRRELPSRSLLAEVLIHCASNYQYLTEVYLVHECTNDVIDVITASCKRLRSFSILFSEDVDDRCIPYISRCQVLNTVQLNYTNVTPQGIVKLLLNVPTITHFNSGREGFAPILEILDKTPKNFPLNLREVTLDDPEAAIIDTMHKFCPKLQEMLWKNVSLNETYHWKFMPFLKKIRIRKSYLSLTSFFTRFLGVQGSVLNCLILYDVENLRPQVVINISSWCPNLQSLEFYNCALVNSISTAHMMVIHTNALYKNLTNFECNSTLFNEYFTLFLSNCTKIRRICLESTNITDEAMFKLMEKNPMRELEELSVYYCLFNFKMVQMIFNNCPNLKKLHNLRRWNGVTAEELKEFKDFIKASNLNLEF